jgi:hypothetical protein
VFWGEFVLALYSTVSRLAYEINVRFYDDTHWVWAAPAPSSDPSKPYNPNSSHPWRLYHRYISDIDDNGGDGHSGLISRNRTGIMRGAQSREAQGLISAKDRGSIEQIAQSAQLKDFYPMFMVIPYSGVASIAQEVDLGDKANPMSSEYVIADLLRSHFDVWSDS